MVSKRRSIHTASNNFRFNLNDNKTEPRGTKPTPDATSVKEILTLMILHACKKCLFFDTNLKVALYLGALFLISLIADVTVVPKGYLSRSDNAFNQYFVKFAWGWNLLLLLPYVIITSFIYCCGQKDKIIKHHISRIIIATFFWWFWTSLFNFIEARYGICSKKEAQLNTKQTCLKNGHIWNGFDLSGHCFILIYGSLLLIEETRSMINWDSIKEHIRLEEHQRMTNDSTLNSNPLKVLSNQQFKYLNLNYAKYTPYIRGLFITMTVFQILWDVMLICTMLYYHIMIEKFLGGCIAILTWFITYRIWYLSPRFLPNLPGEGIFKYVKEKQAAVPVRKRSLVNASHTHKFMGMPLYATKLETEAPVDSQEDASNR